MLLFLLFSLYFSFVCPYQVEVRSDAVAEPVAVRYAFRNVVERVNLTNTIGLPAFPFRTDTWDDAGFAQ